jgi:hypothetical protein
VTGPEPSVAPTSSVAGAASSRVAVAGIVGLAAALPLVMVAFVLTDLEGPGARTLAVVAAAGVVLPHLVVVYDVASGRRPRVHAAWLVFMTAILAAVTTAQGWPWINVWAVVVTTALLLMPSRAGLLACAPVVVVGAVVAATVRPIWSGPGAWATYGVGAIVWRTTIVFTLTWLVAAEGHLRVARAALADQAVLRQRAVAEHELRTTVGRALFDTVERGRLVVSGALGAERADAELAAMAAGARTALAGARDLVSRYRVSAGADVRVDAVVALLEAAGWDVAVVTAPDGGNGEEDLDAAMSRVLRGAPGAVQVVVGPDRVGLVVVSEEGAA